WPLGTDRVMDGDNAMGALAQAIEATLRAHPIGSTVSPSGQFVVPVNPQVVVPGLSIAYTSTQPEFVVAVFACDVDIAVVDPGLVTLGIFLNGTLWRNANFRTNSTTIGRTMLVTLQGQQVPAAANTFEVRAGKQLAGGTVNVNTNSPFMVLRFP